MFCSLDSPLVPHKSCTALKAPSKPFVPTAVLTCCASSLAGGVADLKTLSNSLGIWSTPSAAGGPTCRLQPKAAARRHAKQAHTKTFFIKNGAMAGLSLVVSIGHLEGAVAGIVAIIDSNLAWHPLDAADIAWQPERVAAFIVPPPAQRLISSAIKPRQPYPLIEDRGASRKQTERVFGALVELLG